MANGITETERVRVMQINGVVLAKSFIASFQPSADSDGTGLPNLTVHPCGITRV